VSATDSTPTLDRAPALDILTAVLPEKSQHLVETAGSVLHAKSMLAERGVVARWHLVFDGEIELARVDPRVRAAADRILVLGRRCGVSAARNSGLVGCAAEMLMPLDGDDVLHPEGVAAAVTLLGARAELGWVAGVAEIASEGARSHPEGVSAGRVGPDGRLWSAGELGYAPERPWVGDADGAFCPSAVVMRTELVWAAGGWPAIPAAEDKGLLLRVSAMADGVQLAVPLISYRIWSEQTTACEGFSHMVELATGFNLRALSSFRACT
jgi:hypothetical protein